MWGVGSRPDTQTPRPAPMMLAGAQRRAAPPKGSPSSHDVAERDEHSRPTPPAASWSMGSVGRASGRGRESVPGAPVRLSRRAAGCSTRAAGQSLLLFSAVRAALPALSRPALRYQLARAERPRSLGAFFPWNPAIPGQDQALTANGYARANFPVGRPTTWPPSSSWPSSTFRSVGHNHQGQRRTHSSCRGHPASRRGDDLAATPAARRGPVSCSGGKNRLRSIVISNTEELPPATTAFARRSVNRV